jgi:hypothetical protein
MFFLIDMRLVRRYSLSMRVKRFTAEDLAALLRRQKIGTMDEMKAALGARGDATVFRRLAELSYRTSYSHRGRYYALDEVADYDGLGLWSVGAVRFSRYGTLRATAEALVKAARAGYFVRELESLVHVEAKGALLELVRRDRLARERFEGRYLYTSSDPPTRKKQLTARQVLRTDSVLAGMVEVEIMPDGLKAAIILFFSLLDEKMRRLYAGLEALKIGHGGDRKVADLFSLDPGTVARGRRELLAQDVELEQVRKAGAGRKPTEKKRQR